MQNPAACIANNANNAINASNVSAAAATSRVMIATAIEVGCLSIDANGIDGVSQ